MWLRPVCFLVAACFAAACDSIRPDDAGAGSAKAFDLLTVDGQPLPAPWRLSAEPRIVVRASILLPVWADSVDHASAEWRITLRSPDGIETEVRRTRSYFRVGSVVGFDTCQPQFFCASALLPHSHAVLNGEDLEFSSENGQQALRYSRR